MRFMSCKWCAAVAMMRPMPLEPPYTKHKLPAFRRVGGWREWQARRRGKSGREKRSARHANQWGQDLKIENWITWRCLFSTGCCGCWQLRQLHTFVNPLWKYIVRNIRGFTTKVSAKNNAQMTPSTTYTTPKYPDGKKYCQTR